MGNSQWGDSLLKNTEEGHMTGTEQNLRVC